MDASKGEKRTVRAAGGVVSRTDPEAGFELVIVHRPKYSDWSLPKGKLERGETEEQAALREVEEETGLRCSLRRPLGVVSYTDPHGRPKTVHYWEMSVDGGSFEPNREVDELRWVAPSEALDLLTHDRDRELLGRL